MIVVAIVAAVLAPGISSAFLANPVVGDAIAGLTAAAKKWFFVNYVALPFDQLFDMGGGVSSAAKEFREAAPFTVLVPLLSAVVFFVGASILLRMRDVAD